MKTDKMLTAVMFAPSWMFYTVCAFSVAFGFVLRLALELKGGSLSGKTIFVQALMSACMAFLAILVKRDYEVKMSIELLLFLTSFFAVFLVSTADKVFKQGFKNYLRSRLKGFLGEEKEEEK